MLSLNCDKKVCDTIQEVWTAQSLALELNVLPSWNSISFPVAHLRNEKKGVENEDGKLGKELIAMIVLKNAYKLNQGLVTLLNWKSEIDKLIGVELFTLGEVKMNWSNLLYCLSLLYSGRKRIAEFWIYHQLWLCRYNRVIQLNRNKF